MIWSCLPWRHEYVMRFEGGRMFPECMRCLKRTAGIEVRTLTQKLAIEAYEDMVQAELDVHGGG